MANCINHRDRKATYLRNGLVYCYICEKWWKAQDDIKGIHTWARPFNESPQSEMDEYSKKMQAAIDTRDRAAKAVLQAEHRENA